MILKYALQYKDGTGLFVALDNASGGYDYAVPLDRAQLWDRREAAEEYNAITSWKNYDEPVFQLVEVSIDHRPVAGRAGQELEDLRIAEQERRKKRLGL